VFLKQVQHPGAEKLMMTDIRNLRTFAALVRRFDLKFDMLSVVDELEEQVHALIISTHFWFWHPLLSFSI
jgi:predicted unusual protein kinase regulating ubiquinone biosynthesis (AarF/ABC1/UbiB family)